MICVGCDDANQMRETQESIHPTCLFWQHPLPELHEEANMNATYEKNRGDGVYAVRLNKVTDYHGEYWKNSAGLGNIDAHYEVYIVVFVS